MVFAEGRETGGEQKDELFSNLQIEMIGQLGVSQWYHFGIQYVVTLVSTNLGQRCSSGISLMIGVRSSQIWTMCWMELDSDIKHHAVSSEMWQHINHSFLGTLAVMLPIFVDGLCHIGGNLLGTPT